MPLNQSRRQRNRAADTQAHVQGQRAVTSRAGFELRRAAVRVLCFALRLRRSEWQRVFPSLSPRPGLLGGPHERGSHVGGEGKWFLTREFAHHGAGPAACVGPGRPLRGSDLGPVQGAARLQRPATVKAGDEFPVRQRADMLLIFSFFI